MIFCALMRNCSVKRCLAIQLLFSALLLVSDGLTSVEGVALINMHPLIQWNLGFCEQTSSFWHFNLTEIPFKETSESNRSVCSAQTAATKLPSLLQEPPPHHSQQPTNLCQSDDAKQPFVVELGTSTRPLLISTATANPSKTLAM